MTDSALPVKPVILIVDDNESKRYIAARTLMRAGYTVVEAATGHAALAKAAELLPDLMVVDIKLPDINGFEICRIIKNNAGTSFIPVLHFSATLNTSESRVYGLEEGADAFLTADAKPEELLATIKALLRMRQTEMALRKRNQQLEIIGKAVEAIVASRNLDDMLTELFRRVGQHADLDYYFQFRLNETGDALLLDSCEGISDAQKDSIQVLPLDISIGGKVAVTKEAVYLPYAQLSSDPKTELLRGFGIRCCICNPLLAGDRLLGILTFASRRRDEFSEDELEFLRLISHYVALAAEKFLILKDAQEANVRKDEFLANMSHEIRTPMNVIIGLGHILSLTNPLTNQQNECIQTLRSSAASLLTLINDLLDTAKIESKAIILENTPFDLLEVTQDIVDMMQRQAGENHTLLQIDCDQRKSYKFLGDPTRVRQILLNLTSNAIKFTKNGTVTISVDTAEKFEDGTLVLITVADTGVGIAQEKQKAIFNKFSQADTSITRKYGGTGLGLAITKAIVEMMSGEISVQSEAGKGAAFTVALKMISISENEMTLAPDKIRIDKKFLTNKRDDSPLVLLAEDHQANRQVAIGLLDMLGYRYEVAENGREALALLQKTKFDVILMDVQMPEIDGFRATRAIRQNSNNPNARTPIIGITAFATNQDRQRCLEAGMDEYASKPYDFDDLVTKINTLVDRSKMAAN